MLTNDEQKVYDALTKAVERDGFTPTLRELGDDVGINHVTVRKLLMDIEKKGFIRRIPDRFRAIKILRRPTDGVIAA